MGLVKTLKRRWEQRGVREARRTDRRGEFHGNSKGGWWICPDSAGLGTNVSFDLSLIRAFGCQVHGFDPTPDSLAWLRKKELPPQFCLHPFGLADFDGEARFSPSSDPREPSHTLLERPETAGQAVAAPVRRLSTTMRELGHEHVDLLKLDIEGAEYGVIAEIVRDRIPVAQLLVEYHHRFPGVGVNKTNEALDLLEDAGYAAFHVSDSGREYSFLKG
jgi:FkbM family methyltransferase